MPGTLRTTFAIASLRTSNWGNCEASKEGACGLRKGALQAAWLRVESKRRADALCLSRRAAFARDLSQGNQGAFTAALSTFVARFQRSSDGAGTDLDGLLRFRTSLSLSRFGRQGLQ